MSKAVITCTWNDVPHLSEGEMADMEATYPPHQRQARTRGIPMLGAGAIYAIEEESFLIEPMKLPDHWPRAYGLDVGWNKTAAVWGAFDTESDVLYLYDEYYRGEAEPPAHAAAITARGRWIHGLIDPAAGGRSQRDGRKLLQEYRDLGLELTAADNALEAGIHRVYMRLTSARLRVFNTLQNWLTEYRLYRRDEHGKVAREQMDHLMDATRYLCSSGKQRARASQREPIRTLPTFQGYGAEGWLAT